MGITTNAENRKAVFSMEQVAIFCVVYDFCKVYEEYCMHSLMIKKRKSYPEQEWH